MKVHVGRNVVCVCVCARAGEVANAIINMELAKW